MLFSESELNPHEYNPLALAYIGDTVYDLFIRTKVLEKGNRHVTDMHKESVRYVNAHSQCISARSIESILTEEEIHVLKWGRNAKSNTSPKNADIVDYRTATGFETLLGFLYLKNDYDRLAYIMNAAFDKIKQYRSDIFMNHATEIHAYEARKHALTGIYNAGCGHPGGSLSIADILAVLYFEKMNIDPSDPLKQDRDRFVLSKGHCAPILYGILAERGYFPIEKCAELRNITSNMQGHPDMKSIPGVDMSTGSLGQGISAANGMALSAKLSGQDYRVYSILGDGEIEEGQVWEAAMFAAHYKLDNLTAFLDCNGLQIDGPTSEVMNSAPLDEKFRAFNWHVITIDAHNFDEIRGAIEEAKQTKGKPTMIIAKSVKGKGVSYMENQAKWHGMAPNAEDYALAIKELDEIISNLKK